MITLHVLLVVIPLLVVVEGFFSGAEIALLSADKLGLRHRTKQGHAGAKLALALANHPERVFSTTLLVTNLCVISVSTLIALWFLATGAEHAELLSVAVASPLILLFGEMIPKTIYQRHADRLAPWVAYPVHLTYWIFLPATRLLALYTTRLSRMIGPLEELLTGRRRSTREELEELLSYGKRETEIKASEKRMIKRIFEFKDSEARNALIPLVKVEAIEVTSTVREALERFENHRHSRMPVYDDRIDNIVGVLESADLFTATDLGQPIRNYVSTAHYVAETQSLEDLIKDMKREDLELVVVVDEHGGAVGIVTFEDIVEEIVGEINDEYDSESTLFRELAEGSWLTQARMEIAHINESLRLALPEGDYETLSGFLLKQFGRIPEPRDELFFSTPAGLLKFTIRKATERHIETVLIDRMEEPRKARDAESELEDREPKD